MTERLSSNSRALALTGLACAGIDKLATIYDSDGIAALGSRQPWLAYNAIRTVWRRSLAIGAIRIMSVQEYLPEGILLDLDAKRDRLAVQEWADGYLPLVTQIEDPLHVVLYALSSPTILDKIRGKSLNPNELRADFIVPPLES